MALVSHFDMELHQTYVKIAFFNNSIEEEICMVQPKKKNLKWKFHNIWFANKGIHLWCKSSIPSMVFEIWSCNIRFWF